jgi:hypothetical protein
MKGFLVMAVAALVTVAGVYVFREAQEPQALPRESGASPGAGSMPTTVESNRSLRDQLLHATAEQLGVAPVRGVWGVLMERGYAKGVATVVALVDGTASMYVSTGGSAVGGRAYPPARTAAVKLCELAADLLGETIPAHDFPAPAKGRVRFYVLASGGVRVAEGDVMPARDAGRDPLSPLLAAGDAVLDGLKEATRKGLIR